MPPAPTTPALELQQLVARGGQGELWRGTHHGNLVAIKLVPQGPRLEQEWARLRTLQHVSIVRAHDRVDLPDGRAALVLAWIEGRPLHEAVLDPRWSLVHAEHVARHLIAALAYVHAQGVIHRDVKPANVLVDERFFSRPEDPAFVLLVDFGIAAPVENRVPITDLGAVAGTPAYLAPEVLLEVNTLLDARRDVFAWGVLTWELLAGCHPLGRPATGMGAGLFYARGYDRVRSGERRFPEGEVPARFDPMVRACLAIDPRERPRDAGEALAIIEGRASMASAPRMSGAPTVTLGVAVPSGKQRKSWLVAGVGLAALAALVIGVAVAAVVLAPPPQAVEGPSPTCVVTDGVLVNPPRAGASASMYREASERAEAFTDVTRGSIVKVLGKAPAAVNYEGWYHVRVVCVGGQAVAGPTGYVDGVSLPSLLPTHRLRRAAQLRLRGDPRSERDPVMLAGGTRVAILTLTGGTQIGVRVLDGPAKGETGWIKDVEAVGR